MLKKITMNLAGFYIFEKKTSVKITTSHILVFYYIHDCMSRKDSKKQIFDNTEYTHVAYRKLCEALPSVHIINQVVLKKVLINTLIEAGIILKEIMEGSETETYFSITEEAQRIILDEDLTVEETAMIKPIQRPFIRVRKADC